MDVKHFYTSIPSPAKKSPLFSRRWLFALDSIGQAFVSCSHFYALFFAELSETRAGKSKDLR